MIKNYFKTAWRSMFRHRMTGTINILGLAAAFSFVLLIAAFVWNEVQVDSSIKNVERQYLVQSEFNQLTTSGMLVRALHEEYPDLVEDYFRYDGITAVLSPGSDSFQKSAIIADSSFFRMFGFELLHGDTRTALSTPTQVVLNYETAIQFFGHADVVGQHINVASFSGEKQLFTVSGVLRPYTQNSITHLIADSPAEVFFPLESASYFGRQVEMWSNPYIASYITLMPGIRADQLEKPMKKLIQQHIPDDQQEGMDATLVPLATFHLEKADGMVKKMLYTLSIVGCFILLMACINFINISVNTATARLREIGIRKVMGSSKGQLRAQFMMESILTVGLSGLMAIVFYPILSKLATGIFAKELPAMSQLSGTFWLGVPMGVLFIGILAGLYPAFRLSSYRTILSVKGKLPISLERTLIMKGLVGLQLSIATIVLIATTVIVAQINLFFSRDLGYDKDHLLTIQVPRDWSPEGLERMMQIRERMRSNPVVESITLSYDVPAAMNSGSAQLKSNTSDADGISTQMIASDRHYAETYQIPMLAGTFFSAEESSESPERVVINETFSRALGYADPTEALMQPVYFEGRSAPLTISGVSADFYANTMHAAVAPTVWLNVKNGSMYRYFTIRLHSDDIPNALAELEQSWKSLLPEAPFDYRFVDARLQMLYKTEIQLKQTGTAAGVLAVIIVLLGLIGLISQNLIRRTKEIGIRKVLGASIQQIILLFVRDLSMVFIISATVALPISYLLMHEWLQSYHLKTSLDIYSIGLPILLLTGLSLLLIVAQTMRTAAANPVNSLRDE